MRWRLLVPPLLIGLLLSPGGAALHCNGDITTLQVGTDTIYLDERSYLAGVEYQVVYLESNGQEGLQSGARPRPCEDTNPPCSGVNRVLWLLDDRCQHDRPDLRLV